MAAYATVADVQGYTLKTYTASSKPTSTQVQAFLDRRTAELNGILKELGITVPIAQAASPDSYSILTMYNAIGAGADAESPTALGIEPELASLGRSLRAMYESFLKQLRDRPGMLHDATRSATDEGPTSYGREHAGDDDVKPQITRGRPGREF